VMVLSLETPESTPPVFGVSERLETIFEKLDEILILQERMYFQQAQAMQITFPHTQQRLRRPRGSSASGSFSRSPGAHSDSGGDVFAAPISSDGGPSLMTVDRSIAEEGDEDAFAQQDSRASWPSLPGTIEVKPPDARSPRPRSGSNDLSPRSASSRGRTQRRLSAALQLQESEEATRSKRLPSLQEMQGVVFRELSNCHAETHAQTEKIHSVAPVRPPETDMKGSPVGVVATARMTSMNMRSQKHILGFLKKQEGEEVENDWNIRFFARHSCCLSLAVGLPAFCQIAVAIAIAMMNAHTITFYFTLVSVILYASLAMTLTTLLGRAMRSADFDLALTQLHLFVADFTKTWKQVSRGEWWKYVFAWFLIVAVFVSVQAWEMWRAGSLLADAEQVLVKVFAVLSFVSLGISSACIIWTTHLQAHVLIGLDQGLDCWCFELISSMDFHSGIESWNALQALLKSVARQLASSFLALFTLVVCGFVYFLVSGVVWVFQTDITARRLLMEGLSSLPLLFLFILGMRLFAFGADLTEKCREVPAFVNQIPSSNAADLSRQYLVRYITDSSPGFVVKDVKLTRELFMKQVILFAGLVSGMASALSRIYL